MKLTTLIFLNEKNLQTGVKVHFKEVETKQGKGMSLTTKTGDKYIIAASLDNFNRFSKWNDKEAVADILPLKRKVKTKEGKVELVRLRTDVEVDAKFKEVVDRDDQGNMVF